MENEEELSTLSELLEEYERGNIPKTAKYFKVWGTKQYKNVIWLPLSELKAMSEYQNSEEYKKQQFELFYGK